MMVELRVEIADYADGDRLHAFTLWETAVCGKCQLRCICAGTDRFFNAEDAEIKKY
jgi:hypothetical protein